MKFPGVLLLVSHDRYLIDKLTDQLFIIEDKAHVRIYLGNYTDYRFEQEEKKQVAKDQNTVNSNRNSIAPVRKKISFNDQKEYDDLSRDISEIESTIRDLTEKLNHPGTDQEELIEVSVRIQDLNKILDEKMLRWIELSELVES